MARINDILIEGAMRYYALLQREQSQNGLYVNSVIDFVNKVALLQA